MKTVTINRYSDDGTQTLGELFTDGFYCKTLEKPWKNNISNISCIPKGDYICVWRFMWSKMAWHYQVMSVANRSSIFIHPGNYFFDIKGCILVGDKYGDLNRDKWADILNSSKTLKRFESLMNKQEFILRIQ